MTRRVSSVMATRWVPMDEALTQVVIDLSGRPYLVFNGEFTTPVLGGNLKQNW